MAMEIVKEAYTTIYTMWLREMIKFWRSKARIIAALSTPLTLMFFLAPGIISGFQSKEGGQIDISFFAPGLIGMSVLFASLFVGISILWEREFGILKGTIIAPVRRLFIALGKAVGGVTIAMIQGIMIMLFAMLLGVRYDSFMGVLGSIFIMFLAGLGFNGLGIALAAKIDSQEAFQMIMSFITMPIVLLSGAFFPIKGLPLWLMILIYLNPLTYGVEALRWCLSGTSTVPISLCLLVVVVFDIFVIGLAGKLFEKMKV